MNKQKILGILLTLPLLIFFMIPVGMAIYESPVICLGMIAFIGSILTALKGISLLGDQDENF